MANQKDTVEVAKEIRKELKARGIKATVYMIRYKRSHDMIGMDLTDNATSTTQSLSAAQVTHKVAEEFSTAYPHIAIYGA